MVPGEGRAAGVRSVDQNRCNHSDRRGLWGPPCARARVGEGLRQGGARGVCTAGERGAGPCPSVWSEGLWPPTSQVET